MWDTSFWKHEIAHLEPLRTLFHHCMWGGTRRKLTRLIHNVPKLRQLVVKASATSTSLGEGWSPVAGLHVDASNDDDRAGIGGVLISENSSFVGHFSDFLETEVSNVLNPHLSENPIFEEECFAIWCGIETWSKLFRGCNLIVLTDSEGALNCMIHGTSKNDVGGCVVLATHNLCDEAHAYPWFERVNTASNLAGRPSRGESSPNWGAKVNLDILRLARVAVSHGGSCAAN